MSATYGYQTTPRDDPLVQIVENAVAIGFQVIILERAILLKMFPFTDILYSDVVLTLPDWCWGFSIKCEAQASTKLMTEMTEVPFRYMKQHMAENLALGQFSMVEENLQRMDKQDQTSKPLFEAALKIAATTAIIGSYEMTTSVLIAFALAMASYLDVQKHAQVEIDTVVGHDPQ
ncbi:uncharacterized protein EDB93DRAFT_1109273 [Suillus bovinus]|uniref:uncharacterized protein n=1 Tax=Suillus bovinus TaxID=48563 RepID=UPI001B87E8FE|nr:uncharacterized protein EDB93DRAFT_1109273 [Suillus bovinus]KAG2127540.1 hypothetical protein EDB93DRAFT_1109273 [Suillus bovinus]